MEERRPIPAEAPEWLRETPAEERFKDGALRDKFVAENPGTPMYEYSLLMEDRPTCESRQEVQLTRAEFIAFERLKLAKLRGVP